MKNNLLKYYTVAFYLCCTFVTFAQTPGAEDDAGTLQGEEPAAPIDNYLWVLAVIGLIYVFYRLRSLVHQQSVSKE